MCAMVACRTAHTHAHAHVHVHVVTAQRARALMVPRTNAPPNAQEFVKEVCLVAKAEVEDANGLEKGQEAVKDLHQVEDLKPQHLLRKPHAKLKEESDE
jgi:hypothetical protein